MNKDHRLNDPDWLRTTYQSMSINQIAEHIGCSRGLVRNRLVMFNIQRRKPGWAALKGRSMPETQRAKISMAKAEYWKERPDRDGFRRKVSDSRRRRTLSQLNSGYRTAYDPDQITDLEHRLVAETVIGRKLRDDEVIHHINHVKDDNRPENLKILSPSEHSRLHISEKPRDVNGRVLPPTFKGSRRLYRDDTRKECGGCGEIKPRSEFPPYRSKARPKADPSGSRCHDCDAASQRSRRQMREQQAM